MVKGQGHQANWLAV